MFFSDSDREDPAAESRTGGLVVAPKQMSSALGSLVANYGSMSESDEEPEGEFSTILKLLQNKICISCKITILVAYASKHRI